MKSESITGQKATALCYLLGVDLAATVVHTLGTERSPTERLVTAQFGSTQMTIIQEGPHITKFRTSDGVNHVIDDAQGNGFKRLDALLNSKREMTGNPHVRRIHDENAEAGKLKTLAKEVFGIIDQPECILQPA